MRKPTRALIAVLVCGAVSVDADVVRTRGGGSGGAATAVTPGTTTVTGCQNRVIYGDNSSVLNCEAALGYTASTDTLTAGVVAAGAGLVSATSLRMTDADTGLYEVSSSNWGWAVNGTERVRLGSGGAVSCTDGLVIGTTISGGDVAYRRYAAGVGVVTNSTGTSRTFLMGGGTAVASAATLPLPTGSVFHVTGTTNITGGITSTNLGSGVQITLIFDGVLTVSSGGNLIIVGGTFVTTANDTLTLVYDGTNFFEIARTVL